MRNNNNKIEKMKVKLVQVHRGAIYKKNRLKRYIAAKTYFWSTAAIEHVFKAKNQHLKVSK
uniref:Uncharacterized protein n=1 Tax=Triticum urartu TaxID=4572 RepID=A0A8R7UPV5_TRIUA